MSGQNSISIVASPQKEDYHEPRPHSPPGCKRLVQHARHSLRQPALRYTIRRRVTQGRVTSHERVTAGQNSPHGRNRGC